MWLAYPLELEAPRDPWPADLAGRLDELAGVHAWAAFDPSQSWEGAEDDAAGAAARVESRSRVLVVDVAAATAAELERQVAGVLELARSLKDRAGDPCAWARWPVTVGEL